MRGNMQKSKKRNIKLNNNPNWKGGITITSHGYRKIKKPEHPFSDISGYVYEHRLVMEKKLGRYLKPNEIVHHIDENRLNNNPDNLEVLKNIKYHKFVHRKNKNLRKPDEKNIYIFCGCGCGKKFLKYDKKGRPRKYLACHWRKL